jgi:nitronate monooxygenase
MSVLQFPLNHLKLPIIGAPMFLVSQPNLVIAQCCAGICGTFPAINARPQSELKKWIQLIKAECKNFQQLNPTKKVAPFGVNLVALESNKRLQQDLEICIEEKVPIIITSMKPPTDVVKAVHSYGGLHFHDVINRRHALKAIEAGVDGLILVCNGAGGHAGNLNPFAFLSEIRQIYDGIIILAGCISTGKDILASQILGADLVYMGTRFIATTQANAVDDYKNMIIKSNSNDIIYTPEFTGVSANFLKKSIEKMGINPNKVASHSQKKPNKLWLYYKHWKMKKIKKWKDLWSAGQGVSSIHTIETVETCIDTLYTQYKAAIEHVDVHRNIH